MTDSAKRDVPAAAAAAKPATTATSAEAAGARSAGAAKAAKAAGAAGARQPEAEPAATKDGAAAAVPDAPDPESGSAKPDIDEVKRKFREALDRKREIHSEGQDRGGRDPGKIHGSHGPASSRRSFRRKSG